MVEIDHGQTYEQPDPARAELLNLRDQIDTVDRQLLSLLSQRVGLVHRVGEVKRAAGLPIKDAERERTKVDSLTTQGEEIGVPPHVVNRVWTALFETSYEIEEV